MKIINISTHPYTLIICFFLIFINGEGWGGFYLLYLLLALPFGGVHSLLALLGIIILLISYHKYKRKKIYAIESIMNISGIFLLILSLFFFFYNDKQHYNYGTFTQLVPQVSLMIFGIISFVAICNNIINIYKLLVKTRVLDINN